MKIGFAVAWAMVVALDGGLILTCLVVRPDAGALLHLAALARAARLAMTGRRIPALLQA